MTRAKRCAYSYSSPDTTFHQRWLQAQKPDVVLLDIGLPNSTAFRWRSKCASLTRSSADRRYGLWAAGP
jgi:DNA-binding NarL/FixJ family response regulator